MEQFAFVFTIFFMLLGPVKLIPAFAGVTRDVDEPFRRAVALRATLIGAAVLAFVALAGTNLVDKYHLSIDALRIGGGLVLLLAALHTIFQWAPAPDAGAVQVSPIRLAVSPVVSPIMVPPAGVAAVLILMMLAPQYPGIERAVIIALAIILVLDFLVMFFNSSIARAAWLMLVLQLLGSVLVFLQACLGIETMLDSVRHLQGS